MDDYRRFLIEAAPRAALADAGLLILRAFTGLALALAHGLGKVPPSDRFVDRVGGMGFPAPEFFAWAAGFAEFVSFGIWALEFHPAPPVSAR